MKLYILIFNEGGSIIHTTLHTRNPKSEEVDRVFLWAGQESTYSHSHFRLQDPAWVKNQGIPLREALASELKVRGWVIRFESLKSVMPLLCGSKELRYH